MQVVVRALRVLALIGEGRPQGVSLTELGSELDLPLPTVHRLLKVLIAEGMVYRDPQTLQHFPDENLLKMTRPRSKTSISELVGPRLRQLSAQFDETAFVTQLVGQRAVCLALAESQRPLRISVEVGLDLPLHASSAARVLLAHRDPSVARGLLDGYEMTKFTPHTPATVEDVVARLERIRERGYEMSADELDRNIWSVAVPLRLPGEAVASLSVAAPLDRSLNEELRVQILEAAQAAAADVESAAGAYVVA